ncbi:MAG: diguanylate cyclase [Oscillospiraceae bacterium]|nr:diguanylate cyclase [Oscillospiraceae bacterium]
MISRLKDTLLLVGSASSERIKLREIFQSGFDLLEAESVNQARLLLEQNGRCVAAVLADLPEGEIEPIRILAASCRPGSSEAIPLILLVSPSETGALEEALFALGVTDVITRPYTTALVQHRVQTIIDLFLHQWHLEKLVDEQSQTIRNTNQVMLDALSAIIEHRSTESGHHVLRIRRFTEILLKEVASACPEYGLTGSGIGIIASAAALHDIGKISIPDSILNKPGRLTEDEFEIIKTHTTVGGQLVKNLSGMGDAEYLRYAYNIALYHHERWDGRGYPTGLKGDEIPICAQAVGLADAFDALTSQRVYKDALPYEKAVNMIVNGECGTFSPRLVECFKRVRTQFVRLAHQYADGYNPKSDHITMPLPGPEWKSHALDSLQLSQVKYQAALHYINDTVLELDLDNELYHVVYNPNPDLDDTLLSAPFSRMVDQLISNIHPEDADVLREMQRFLSEDFFRLNLRRKSFPCRLFSPTTGSYQPYELVFLRVNTGNADQRIVIAIWHRLERLAPVGERPVQSVLHASPALYGLVSTALRCRSDREQTIDLGSEHLFSLTGYTDEEVEQMFHSRLSELVVPEDREAFLSGIQQRLQDGGRGDMEYRIVRKGSDPIWVLDRSRVYMENDGQEYLYHAIRDNTPIRNVINELRAEAMRHELLTSQSEGVIFDLDLNQDRLTCSHRWEEMFGYKPLSEHFVANISQNSHFHPDDLSPIVSWADAMRRGETDVPYLEARILNSKGKYVWCRIHARLQQDENTHTNRIVGIIYDIDEYKQTALALKERAERDALTKLLNKASTQQLVTEYLNTRDAQELSALLLLDLDNFKTINDTYGHLYGDAVLSQIGSNLRRLFRSQDIIGRIGGDEFLIFLKDIPTADLVADRCTLLLNTFRELFERLCPDLNVSCSIGAALAPTHGSVWSDLFQRADEALYLAKGKGKDQYKLYNARDKINALLKGGSHVSTRIDSDEQPNITDSSFIRHVFRALYESSNIETTVDELLAHIGAQFNVSRAYIFENNEDNTTCSNTFEWCNEGIEPQIQFLQDISYITDIPGWPDVYDENGLLYCSDVSELAPTARAILEPQGVKSMLHCSIRDNGVFRGYIGFDDCHTNRMWTQEQISLLQLLSEVMAMFLLKKRSRDRALEQAANLQTVLDAQNAWVYVIDPETGRLRFLNAKTKSIAPDARPDMLCYEVFMGRDSRCPDCPALKLARGETPSSLIVNNHYGLRVNASATPITWNGVPACMITCQDQTE